VLIALLIQRRSQPAPSTKDLYREARDKALSANDLNYEARDKAPLSANSEANKGGALHSKAKL